MEDILTIEDAIAKAEADIVRINAVVPVLSPDDDDDDQEDEDE